MYRLYLLDPEETETNEEWVPPDTYFINTKPFIDLNNYSKNSLISWNTSYKIDRDYIYHGLILLSFNKAFSKLDESREVLDFISDFLLQYEILRQDDIVNFLKNFVNLPQKLNTLESSFLNSVKLDEFKNLKNKNLVLESFWGKNSRRKINHFIKFI